MRKDFINIYRPYHGIWKSIQLSLLIAVNASFYWAHHGSGESFQGANQVEQVGKEVSGPCRRTSQGAPVALHILKGKIPGLKLD